VSCAAYGANKPDYATILVPATTADSAKPGLCCDLVSSVPALLMLCEVLILTDCWRVRPTRPGSLLQWSALSLLQAGFLPLVTRVQGQPPAPAHVSLVACTALPRTRLAKTAMCINSSVNTGVRNTASIFSGWQNIACASLQL
jgi:hypothetical protein